MKRLLKEESKYCREATANSSCKRKGTSGGGCRLRLGVEGNSGFVFHGEGEPGKVWGLIWIWTSLGTRILNNLCFQNLFLFFCCNCSFLFVWFFLGGGATSVTMI